MRIFNTQQMKCENLNLQNVAVVSVHEKTGKTGIFSATKRKTSVLCFYVRGHRRYYLNDSKSFFDLKAGDIIYIPQETAYRFKILDTENEKNDWMIALHFHITDEKGETVNFGQCPRILLKDKLDHYFSLFKRIEDANSSGQENSLLLKSLIYSLLYEIINQLLFEENRVTPYNMILPAVLAMQADPSQDVPIPEFAKMCGISQTRFRELFNLYTDGLSPVEYRNKLRIERVEQLLFTGEITVDQAAFKAGFRDLSHFYRIWKKYRAKLPSKYK